MRSLIDLSHCDVRGKSLNDVFAGFLKRLMARESPKDYSSNQKKVGRIQKRSAAAPAGTHTNDLP